MSDLDDLYSALEDMTDQLLDQQPWWPCKACPVQQTRDNCCHKAMFHVTATEWETLRQHPYIQENLPRLRKEARRTLHKLRSAGYDTHNWSETVATFGNNALDFTCPLLGPDGLCQTYDSRPGICRLYGMSRKADADTIYGCPIVVDSVQQHPGQVSFVPLDDVLDALTEFAQPPVQPIVAWLANAT